MEESIQAWMIFLKHLVTLDSEESFFCSNFAPLKGQPTKKNTHHFGCFFTFFSRRGNVKKDKILASKQPPSIPQLFRIDLSFFQGDFFFRSTRGWSWRVRRGDWCLERREVVEVSRPPISAGWGDSTKWWWLWKNPIPQKCPKYEGLGIILDQFAQILCLFPLLSLNYFMDGVVDIFQKRLLKKRS